MIRPIAILNAVVFLAGCSAGTLPPSDGGTTTDGGTNDAPAAPGKLQLDWTIGGVSNPTTCSQQNAAKIVIEISKGATSVGTFTAPCGDLTYTMDLPAGAYSFGATLVDSQNKARTTTAQGPAVVQSNQTVIAPVDFPLTSFY